MKIMKNSFYKSMTPFSRYQLTIIYVIPLDKPKNFKFISE